MFTWIAILILGAVCFGLHQRIKALEAEIEDIKHPVR